MKPDPQLPADILDSMKNPVLFADRDHVVRYMNKAAAAHYEQGEVLLGSSLFECHNANSGRIMREVFAEMEEGLDERLITDNEKHRISMRAVRDASGALIGYYERYEPPVKPADAPERKEA